MGPLFPYGVFEILKYFRVFRGPLGDALKKLSCYHRYFAISSWQSPEYCPLEILNYLGRPQWFAEYTWDEYIQS